MAEGALKNSRAATRRGGDRHRRSRRRQRGKARGAGLYRRRAPAGDTIMREYRFGDIGRGTVRLGTVEKAIQLLRGCL